MAVTDCKLTHDRFAVVDVTTTGVMPKSIRHHGVQRCS